MRTYGSSPKPFLVALAVVVLLLLGGCGVAAYVVMHAPPLPASEAAARDLIRRELLDGRSTSALSAQQELRSGGKVVGYAWRYAPEGTASTATGGLSSPSTTYFAVLACVDGDRATAAVYYSVLRYTQDGCRGGEPQLTPGERTPEQALGSLAGTLPAPEGRDRSDAVLRAPAGAR